MSDSFRSGNSRLLAKTLDAVELPIAVLDRKGVVVFANAPLCELVQADATQLVGKQSSWQLASDELPFAALLTALAPPARALQGKIVARQLTTPIVFGSTATGQLFVPLLELDGRVHATLVVLGNWEEIMRQMPVGEATNLDRRQHHERALVTIRSRWSNLDQLHSLIGESPQIQLAMNRAQMAIAHPCNLFLHGPKFVGKSGLARGVFAARLKKASLPKTGGQLFPIDCEVIRGDLLDGMLEVFAGRVNAAAQRVAHTLLLESVEKLDSAGVQKINHWLESRGAECVVLSTSRVSAPKLRQRNAEWRQLTARIATLEIEIPALKERREDIPVLAQNLLSSLCSSRERAPLTFSAEAMQLLTAFSWPENLAQLSQAIEEAVNHAVLAAAILPNHLPVVVRTFVSASIGSSDRNDHQASVANFEPIELDRVLQDLERIMLQRALKLSPRNRAGAARWLGISRPRLLRRIEQLGLDAPKAGPADDRADADADTSS